MAYEQIKYEVQDNILTITLNLPDKLNAFTHTMMAELIDAFDKADADDEVRAIIVTGAGRAFCAGADLSAGGATFDRAARADRKTAPLRPNGEVEWSDDAVRDGGGRVTLRIYKCLKPVIGAINGAAVGIGVTMQLPMDIRIASNDARFGFVFARRGIVPEACSSWFLPRIVGISQALEWTYSGKVFPAQEALEGGLVRKVVAPEELLPMARAIAREIVDNTADLVELGRKVRDDEIVIFEDYAYPAYGVPSAETNEAIRLAARTEAMITDPVYEGKSMQGMIDLVKKGYFPEGSKVLYAHLGGAPAINGYSYTYRNG